MKYILLLIPFLLIGCATNQPKCTEMCTVYLPVYEKPKFDMPARPDLNPVSEEMSDGQAVRVVQHNMLDLMNYSKQMEAILLKISK